jgi:hypothetical protein
MVVLKSWQNSILKRLFVLENLRGMVCFPILLAVFDILILENVQLLEQVTVYFNQHMPEKANYSHYFCICQKEINSYLPF